MIAKAVRDRVRMLLGEGHTQLTVARRTGISRRSVVRIAQEGSFEVGSTIGRPSKTQPFADLIRSILIAEPVTRSVAILERTVDHGYPGSRTAMYQRIRNIRQELNTADARRSNRGLITEDVDQHQEAAG